MSVIPVQVHDAKLSAPGKDASITCEVQGSLAGGTYEMTWHRNGEKVEAKEDKYIINTHNNTLTIKDVGECVLE